MVAAAGIIAAVALPVWRVGIGWPIATIGLLAVIIVARFDGIGGAARVRPDRW